MDNVGARPGTWTHSLSAARQLADTTDRPLLVMFSSASIAYPWGLRFEREINSSDIWNAYASEQQLAMAYMNRTAYNWDDRYYWNVVSNNPAITEIPAFVLYASDGVTVLDAFTFTSNVTFTASAFVSRINDKLLANDYRVKDVDLWEPADNSAVGATVLEFKTFSQRQYHEISVKQDDTDDWFKFSAVSGRRYKLQIPASDLQTGFTPAASKAQFADITNTFPVCVVTNAPSLVSVTTNRGPAVTDVIILGVCTNFELDVTNSLPFSEHLVTNAVLAAETNAFTAGPAFVNKTVLMTNLPSASARAFTNGASAKLISPTLTLLDPARQTRLNFDAGPLGTTNQLMLASLTNGYLFTVPAPYNNQPCFLTVNWGASSNTPPAFDAVTYSPPVTNLTVTTMVSNLLAAVVTRQTVTNVWLTVTYSGPTDVPVDDAPGSDSKPAFIVSSNLVVETSVLTFTNTFGTPVIFTGTNSVITEGSNVVTFTANSRYALNYRFWEPGEVGFTSTNIQASETGARVQLTVVRKGGSGGDVHLRYRFEDADTPGRDYEAENGKDFKAVEGNLFWAEGEAGSTNITVDLIQDLRPTWEGPERFAVVLERNGESAYLQAAVSAASNAVVTLRESARKNAGTFGFAGSSATEVGPADPFPNAARPTVTVSEDAAVTLWVARAGGSDGPARVRVVTVNGTAKESVDFDSPDYPTLEWADKEDAPQGVTIGTLARDGFNRDAQFTVKLVSELNAPLSSAATVTVTLRDEATAQSLADTAAAAARCGATFKSISGNWFWTDASTLRCVSPSRAGSSALSLALTGPGVLTFNWGLHGGSGPDQLVCAGGVLVGKSLAAAGPTASVLLKPGKQTVTWTFAKASAVVAEEDAYAFVSNLTWLPMTRAASPTPEPNARTCDLNLTWQMPPAVAVHLYGDFETDVSTGLVQTATVTAVTPRGATLANVVTNADFSALWPDPASDVKRSYTWRVDTVFTNADGRLTSSGTPWSFNLISAGSPTTDLPTDGFQSAPGVYEAVQGVRCDFGAITEDPEITYAVTSGALPSGLALDKATGGVAGVPAKAGTWTVLLQATQAADGIRVPYATVALTFIVHPLGSLAGTYNGWIKDADSPMGYCGLAALTVGENGKLTAKVTAQGATYSFSATGFDGADDVVAPGSVTLDTCAGGWVTGPGGTRYHTLDNLVVTDDGTATASLTLYTRVRTISTDEVVPAVYVVELFRTRWGDAAMQPVLNTFKGYYTVALPVMDARDPLNTPWGSGYATLTVSDKGAAKLSGVLADGKTWSLATTLIMADTNDTSSAAVCVYTQPSGYAGKGGLSGLLRITAGASVYGNTVDCPDVVLKWWDFTPASVAGATNAAPSAAAGFLNSLEASGGFYDNLMNLQTYYLCKDLSFEDNVTFPGTGLLDRLPSDADGLNGISRYLLLSEDGFLPFGTAVDVGARSLSVKARNVVSNATDAATASLAESIDLDQSRNVAGLLFAFNPVTGLFSGSFDLVYERENANGQFVRRTRKTAYKGVYTPTRPVDGAEDPSAGVQGAGFYLVPDTSAYLDGVGKVHSYTFNWSFAFELFSVEAHDATWCDGDVTHE